MVKRLFCIAVCLITVLASACGGDTPKESFVLDDTLKQAVAAYNELNTLSLAFAFDMKKQGAEESLLFTQGTVSYKNDSALALSGRVTQVKNGKGVTSDIFYKAGAYYSDNGTGKYYLIMDKDEMLKTFFCVDVPLPDEALINGFRKAQTSGGTKYVYTAEKANALYMFETNLYGYSGLRKPVRDKTAFSAAEYSYVVDDKGQLKSFKISTTVTLYDTAPYYPSYTVPQSELMHSFNISLELTVKASGNAVVVETPNTKDYVFLG